MIAGIAPILIALAALLLRLFDLGKIQSLIFDEVYYVDGARDYLNHGVEISGAKAEFVVHPPVGKWLIASGIKLFGDSGFGWRIATAVIGSLSILLIGMIAKRLFQSPLLAALASGLMALDGLALVHSRTALLDNFLTFFILLATYFFIRKQYWWVGIALGLAIGTKWSGLYFLAAFGVIALYRAFTHHSGTALIKPTLHRVIQFLIIPVITYVASWIGWFASDRGWDRDYSTNPFTSLIYYHQQILNFHTTLTEKHPYEANPWSWLIMGRPTSFFYETPKTCGASQCSQEILALGTPLLWWLGVVALAVSFGMWIHGALKRQFDPALTVIVTGMISGYLPWFFFQNRTVFTFYAIVFEPFLILALVYRSHLLLTQYQIAGKIIVITCLSLIFLNFLYFLPIYLGDVITYDAWKARMWFPQWI